MQIQFTALVALVLTLSACSKAPPAATLSNASASAAAPVQFVGVSLPGRMRDAALAGYTQCDGQPAKTICRNSVVQPLYAVTPMWAELVLETRHDIAAAQARGSSLSEHARTGADALSYNAVRFVFASPVYDQACLHRLNAVAVQPPMTPVECIRNPNTVAHMRDALQRNGWVVIASKSPYTYLVHPEIAVTLALRERLMRAMRAEPVSGFTEPTIEYEPPQTAKPSS